MKRVLFIVFVFIAAQSSAQLKKVVADKIIATIGDKIILKSDIENAIFDIERSNPQQTLPPNLGCQILEQNLGSKVLVIQAERDSIPVSDDEVDGDVDNQIRYFTNLYGSKDVLEQIAGKTIFQLKEEYRPVFKDRLLVKGERDKITGDIRITPEEVEAFYNQIPKDSLHFYESHVEIGQVVIYPKPSRDVETYDIDQLKEYKKEVEDGTKKFDVLASVFSDDPGTKDNGGMLDINRNDKGIDPIFLAKAFALKDGQISNVFKSKFGYHIIQMVSRRGDDATVRHILKIPQVSAIEINETIAKMDTVRQQLIDRKLTFGEAVSKYSEDDNSKFTGGFVSTPDGSTTSLRIDQLPDKSLVFMLDSLKVGQYSKPVQFTDPTGKIGVRIIYLASKTQPHRENLKDDYDKVAARALEEKKGATLDKWFAEKVPTFYIDIDPDYLGCPGMTKWETATASRK